jgi:hypothetical protein
MSPRVACVVVARAWRTAHVVVSGLFLLVPAVGLLVAARAVRSLPLLLVATALAGIALALGYRGGLETINHLGSDEHRAEIVSSYLICCFVGNSVPVIGIGVLSSVAAPLTASIAFACTVALLSVAALAWFRFAEQPAQGSSG